LPSLSTPMVANVKVSDITENGATVTWQTNVPTFGGVDYATQDSYSATADKPYDQNSSQTDAKTTDHSITLSGLVPSTSYHSRVSAYSLPGVIGYSEDKTFATKAMVKTTEIGKIGNTDFQVQWITSQKTSSIVEYTDSKTGQTKQVKNVSPVQNHVVSVTDVAPNTTYYVKVFGYDANNNIVEGGNLTVKTTRDVVVPVISNIKINSAMLPGQTNLLQTVVSWVTNEPSSSQVYYDQGVSTSEILKNHVEQASLTTGHILIVPSLTPSTVYRFKIISTDASGNVAQSAIKTVLTPQSEENVIDVIIKNLQESFGFLQNLQ
jgi:hypothetical protein